MTCERICGPQRQPCPSPYLCGTDCYFQTAEIGTPHDKATSQFWDASRPGYYELIDAIPNWWDRNGHWLAISFWLAIGLTGAALLVAGVLR